MAPIAWVDVVAVAPELATGVDPIIQADIISYVNTELSVEGFGGEDSTNYRMARMFLGAHLGSINRQVGSSSSGQTVTSETAGRISRSFAQQSSDAALLSSSPYGRTFHELVMSTPGLRGPMVLV